jgi:hypothetical protein
MNLPSLARFLADCSRVMSKICAAMYSPTCPRSADLDHARDCISDRVVPAQEIGEAFEIAVLRRAHACALLFRLQDAV